MSIEAFVAKHAKDFSKKSDIERIDIVRKAINETLDNIEKFVKITAEVPQEPSETKTEEVKPSSEEVKS